MMATQAAQAIFEEDPGFAAEPVSSDAILVWPPPTPQEQY